MDTLRNELTDTELDGVCGGEMSMICLQSLVPQRQMANQMTTSLLRAWNESSKPIIGNIR